MPLSDAAVVGAEILIEGHFGDGFRDDFDTLDLETSSAAGNRTGKWKLGFMHANMTENGFIYGSDENPASGHNFVHAGINSEDQVYPDTRKAVPSTMNPITASDSVLKIESRLVSGAAEQEYARVKDYTLNPDGTLKDFLFDKQVPYVSGMLSTYGRFAMSFGRFRARVKTPYGAVGNNADINQRKAIFPAALWSLMDIPYGCDINGDPFGDGNTTYRPARPNGGGQFFEIDGDENFGESETKIHQTVHTHPPGSNPDNGSVQYPLTIQTGKDLRSVWRESGWDIFPEKIAFFVDGVYTHVVDTPDEIRNGLPIYEPKAGEEFDPVMSSTHTAKVLGRQQHADSSTRYMCHAIIINLARNGKYPRDLAKQIIDAGGALPAHNDTVSLEVDWVEARPLITDNPDNFPMRIAGVPTAAVSEPVPVEHLTFDETFEFSISHTKAALVGAPASVRCIVTANPLGFPYRFEFEVIDANVPAGINVTISGISGNQISVHSDGEFDLTDVIQVTASQDGEIV